MKHRTAVPVASLALVLASCGGGGGGGQGAEFFVVGASLENDRVLPQEFVYLDDPVRILMSTDVDPESVTAEAVELVNADPGGEPPDVQVVVDGPWIALVPRLPRTFSVFGTDEAGFTPGAEYRLLLPGAAATSTIRSVKGRTQRDAFETRFLVRDSGVLFRDLAPGEPYVESLLVDVDGDGVARGDGLAATSDAEEFFTFSRVPFVASVPPGLLSRPTEIAISLSEPVYESTLLRDDDLDGAIDSVRVESPSGEAVPGSFTYQTAYEPSLGRYRSRISFRSDDRLEPETLFRLVIESGAIDFEAPGNRLIGLDAYFMTGPVDPDLVDAVVEEFADSSRRAPGSTAPWDSLAPGRLVAGTELGGDGSDGDLVTRGDVRIDTASDDGVLRFDSLRVRTGDTLTFVGPRPARILVQGDAIVEGTIASIGGTGAVTGEGPGVVVLGGPGGAGGGSGGAANPGGAGGVSPCGDPGAAPDGVPVAGACPACGAPRGGGGCGGVRDALAPTGGGGGGHATPGGGDLSGGIAYGEPTLVDPLGGSGGGGGGNTAADPFVQDTIGSGGGGGGGVIDLEVGGLLVLGGALDASGGQGGPARFGGGGGGGGSGGSIRVRAGAAAASAGALVRARGGNGGPNPFGFGAEGEDGAPGRVRIESIAPPVGFDFPRVDPAPSVGLLVLEGVRVSTASSLHYDTRTTSPRYVFDGSDPRTGALRERSGDVELVAGIPDGASATIEFFGANEDPAAPGTPDLASEVGPVTDVRELDGKRFVRFAIRFEVDASVSPPSAFSIERISIGFRR